MIPEKYFGKEIKLKQPLPAQIITVDISRDSKFGKVSSSFPITIATDTTITIRKPIKDQFHRGANGIDYTDYYPENGFLFEIKNIKIDQKTPIVNSWLAFETATPNWFEFLD